MAHCLYNAAQNIPVEAVPPPRIEIHRKHSSHIHDKPEIPRRASSGMKTASAPGNEALPSLAPPPPPAEIPVPKSNAWMDVGKRLQRTRDAITAAANKADPEPHPEVGPMPEWTQAEARRLADAKLLSPWPQVM